MTIAGQFEDALRAVADPDLAAPELLPERLARAGARMLAVDGAGISIVGDQGRIPLGASSGVAATAERLQFTVGAGPCMTAEQSGEPVFAVPEDLRRRWPGFADLLFERTPYRAVVALPMQEPLTGSGAIDLYFERPEAVPALDVFGAMSVADLIASALGDAAVWSSWSQPRGPNWLHGPAAERRAAVWEAMGRLELALELDAAAVLALLRAQAYAAGRSVDELAADVLADRLSPEGFRQPVDEHR